MKNVSNELDDFITEWKIKTNNINFDISPTYGEIFDASCQKIKDVPVLVNAPLPIDSEACLYVDELEGVGKSWLVANLYSFQAFKVIYTTYSILYYDEYENAFYCEKEMLDEKLMNVYADQLKHELCQSSVKIHHPELLPKQIQQALLFL